MRFMKKRRRSFSAEDPLLGVANLFDLALVMVIGFMLSLLSAFHLTDALNPKTEFTIVKKQGKRVEIVVKKGREIKVYKPAGGTAEGLEGVKIGTAYRLKDGRIIYVPE
ncbi:MAG: DUF2149 domain-containing protein [Deferribacteres bacterium]|nr:DUF2149 domain-containing protein [Deferribacteres bacterium]